MPKTWQISRLPVIWQFVPLFSLIPLALTGCVRHTSLSHTAEVLRAHIISIDGQGLPHDPTVADGKAMKIAKFRDQIKNMFVAMREFHKTHSDHKILIFVHGGLNAPESALASADQEIDGLLAAGYYPIFLNWNSALLSTYEEHVWRVTQGQTDDGLVRKLLSPLYVVADIGRAVTRAPIIWANQIGTDISAAHADLKALGQKRKPVPTPNPSRLGSQRWANLQRGMSAAATFHQLRELQENDHPDPKRGEPRRQMRVYIGPDLDVDVHHLVNLELSYLLTSPTKFGLSWLIDGIGTPSWDNMSRRTLIAFDGEIGGKLGGTKPDDAANLGSVRAESREQRVLHATDFSATGAFAVFRDELLKVTAHDHVILVGHSMGTIILNEWLRRDVAENRKQFYCNIVYMAAACSVRDFSRSIVPYLLQHGPNPQAADPSETEGTQFYSLMLHPIAELRERGRGYDLPPRGSLLVWLDDFLSDPRSPLDRTLGRWDNIIPAADVIPEQIRGQVTLKAFALAPYPTEDRPRGALNYGPQAHGQFRGSPYGCPGFWYSESPVVPAFGDDCKPLAPNASSDSPR
jgi:hypothetical protein